MHQDTQSTTYTTGPFGVAAVSDSRSASDGEDAEGEEEAEIAWRLCSLFDLGR